MTVIPLGDHPQPSQSPRGWAPFALGFRPFFAAAGLSGLVLMMLWVGFWHQGTTASSYYHFIDWHSHEMLFGFTTAIIAGFLLTAVRNWTGIDTPKGAALALLALLWLAARILPLIPAIPGWIIASIDGAFIPALAITLYHPLISGKPRNNQLFLPLLAGMALANLLYHLEGLGIASTAQQGVTMMINLVLLLLTFVGGRVLPFFTEKAVAGSAPKFSKQREQWVFGCIIAWTLCELIAPIPELLLPLALGVAFTQAWRFVDWYSPGIWKQPMLWVLFAGLGWMIVGFLLKALYAAGQFPPNLSTHALTAGAIGVFTLGMMARVSMGHTGREVKATPFMNLSFILINLAVVFRVFLPVTELFSYQTCIWIAASLWIVSFAIYTLTYLPMLLFARIDGRPG